jgi:hypothetical protein
MHLGGPPMRQFQGRSPLKLTPLTEIACINEHAPAIVEYPVGDVSHLRFIHGVRHHAVGIAWEMPPMSF